LRLIFYQMMGGVNGRYGLDLAGWRAKTVGKRRQDRCTAGLKWTRCLCWRWQGAALRDCVGWGNPSAGDGREGKITTNRSRDRRKRAHIKTPTA